jgi:hypothetical protein
LPMQLLLSGIWLDFVPHCQFGPEHCSGERPTAYKKISM